jgi:hypothetical protein
LPRCSWNWKFVCKDNKRLNRNSTSFAHDGSKSSSLLTLNYQALHQLLPTRSHQEKLQKSNSWLSFLLFFFFSNLI